MSNRPSIVYPTASMAQLSAIQERFAELYLEGGWKASKDSK